MSYFSTNKKIYDNYIKKMMDLLVNVAKESDLIDKLDPKTVDCKDLTSKTSNNDTAVAFESKIAQVRFFPSKR